MATGQIAYQLIARHGAAIEQLRRDMLQEEADADLVQFLAYDVANFVYAYLLATGHAVTPQDRRLRDDVQAAILEALAKHGVDPAKFRVWPERAPS